MKTVIIVNSCDAYADLWDLFFLCMSDYWDGCDYPIVLNTESKNYSCPQGMGFDVVVHHYDSGGTDFWGARLISTLNDCRAEYAIMLYDDFFLNSPVDQKRIKKLLSLMSDSPGIGVVYLTKLLGVQKGLAREDGLSIVPSGADYRLNSAPAIWRKDALLKFTGRRDNPWAWEYFGSYRTFEDGFLFLAIADSGSDIYPYDYRRGGAVYRGKWVAEVIDPIIKKHKLTFDVKNRGMAGSDAFPTRSVKWKLGFMLTGAQMIGYRIFFIILKLLRENFLNWLSKLKN